jgi:hypothetical protein
MMADVHLRLPVELSPNFRWTIPPLGQGNGTGIAAKKGPVEW